MKSETKGRNVNGTLSGLGGGAGNESTGRHLTGSERADSVDASGRDLGGHGSEHAAMAAAV